MSNPWFRHYTGMMRDEKLVAVAVRSKQPVERVVWVWGAILESASNIGEGGRYELDEAEVAYFLRADESDIHAIVSGLEANSRLASGVVVNWGHRQFESDRSKDRQAAYRERKRTSNSNCDVREISSDVTVTSRASDVTAQDTDTDTDTPIAPKGAVSGDGFAEFWEAYPKRDGSNDQEGAKVAYYAAMFNHPPEILIASAMAYAAWCREKGKAGTQYVKAAKSWLSEGHWREWTPKAVASVPVGVLVKPGSPAWDAWQRVKKTPVSDRHGGWYFPTEFPPTTEARAA